MRVEAQGYTSLAGRERSTRRGLPWCLEVAEDGCVALSRHRQDGDIYDWESSYRYNAHVPRSYILLQNTQAARLSGRFTAPHLAFRHPPRADEVTGGIRRRVPLLLRPHPQTPRRRHGRDRAERKKERRIQRAACWPSRGGGCRSLIGVGRSMVTA